LVLYYIQTWVIKKGLEAEHDSLMAERCKKLIELTGEGRIRYFPTVGGSGNGRALIIRLNDQAGYMDSI
jgi:hypothetical protein